MTAQLLTPHPSSVVGCCLGVWPECWPMDQSCGPGRGCIMLTQSFSSLTMERICPGYWCPVTRVHVTLYEIFLPQTQAWKSGWPRQPNHADARLLIRRPILACHWGSKAAYHPLKTGWVQEVLPFDIVTTLCHLQSSYSETIFCSYQEKKTHIKKS